MKKQLLLLFLFTATLSYATAQTTIQLTFTAEVDGSHQSLDSVLIENLTQGGDTTLYGTDTVLVLDNGIGIDDRVSDHGNRMILYPAYPNPVTHTSNIKLLLPQDGQVTLRLYDLMGRELATYRRLMGAGEHTFNFTPGKETFYLLVVEAAGQRHVQKLVSLNPGEGRYRLSHSGTQPSPSTMRKGKSAFPWTPADNLRFVGYAESDADTIADNPVTPSMYTFQFGTAASPTYPPGTVHCDPANPTAIVDVTNPITGKTWMNRNLGALQVATGWIDANSYGDLYQWGRFSDGHQCRTSATTTTLSTTDQQGHGDFILSPTTGDWRSSQNDNLWQGVNGVNNPCPTGYRLPTEAEFNAEIQSWSSQDAAGAINSPLKLPMAGGRYYSDGSFYGVGSAGAYWSCTISGAYSRGLGFHGASSGMSNGNRAGGLSVRCLKDY